LEEEAFVRLAGDDGGAAGAAAEEGLAGAEVELAERHGLSVAALAFGGEEGGDILRSEGEERDEPEESHGGQARVRMR
jgi:hypothetical protein